MTEDDIRTYLLTQSPITTIVGTDAAKSMARIYFNARQQDITADSIVIRRVGTSRGHCLTGGAGYATMMIEFDCVSLTPTGAKTLANALRGELQCFNGTMGSVTVFSVVSEDESDEYDEPVDASNRGQFHSLATYSFLVQESIPTF